MEEATRILAKKFDRVIVNMGFMRNRPAIRFQAKKLEDLKPIKAYAITGAEASQRIWDKTGGLLLSYRKDFLPLAHDAQLIAECPFSETELETWTKATTGPVVIYRPPSWSQNEETAMSFAPSGDTCKRIHDNLIHATKLPANPALPICKVVGLADGPGVVLINDYELCDRVGLPRAFLGRARRVMMKGRFRFSYHELQELVCRIEPKDKNLMPTYTQIKELPALGSVRVALDRKVNKMRLKELIRCGSVERRGAYGYYLLSEIKPDFEAIQNEHLAAKARFQRITALVDAAPVFSLKALAESRPLRRRTDVRSSRSPARA